MNVVEAIKGSNPEQVKVLQRKLLMCAHAASVNTGFTPADITYALEQMNSKPELMLTIPLEIQQLVISELTQGG